MVSLTYITKEEAKQQGLTRYFIGQKCVHGHVAERYTRHGGCVECARLEKRRYQKKPDVRVRNNIRYKKYHAENKDKERQYRQSNIDKIRVYRRNRKLKNKLQTPAWFGEFDAFILNEASELCIIRERETGFSWHIDHMFPLSAKKVCGLHCAENFQVIPATMNTSKQNKMILTNRYEWLK